MWANPCFSIFIRERFWPQSWSYSYPSSFLALHQLLHRSWSYFYSSSVSVLIRFSPWILLDLNLGSILVPLQFYRNSTLVPILSQSWFYRGSIPVRHHFREIGEICIWFFKNYGSLSYPLSVALCSYQSFSESKNMP